MDKVSNIINELESLIVRASKSSEFTSLSSSERITAHKISIAIKNLKERESNYYFFSAFDSKIVNEIDYDQEEINRKLREADDVKFFDSKNGLSDGVISKDDKKEFNMKQFLALKDYFSINNLTKESK